MIDINKLFIRLLEDLEESSPNLRKSLKEISPLEFCINIKGHKNIYIKIDDKDSEISFGKNNSQRQFYTVPGKTNPNDLESYKNWLYSTPPTCKEGNGLQCAANQIGVRPMGKY